MLALTYDRKKDPWESTKGLRQQDVPAPVLDESKDYRDTDKVLVKPKFGGFCGSDRGIWFRRAFKESIYEFLDKEKKDVRVIGHELFGEIVDVGAAARRVQGYEPGLTVTTESHIICGVCYQCRIGDNHVCQDARTIGFTDDGCFAEAIKLPANVLWPVDTKKIRPEVAALMEPFGNAVHACTKVPIRGKTVAIIGCGTIGLFAVAVARALGARKVFGVEPMESHARMARRLGAADVLAPRISQTPSFERDTGLAGRIRELTEGVGVDVALEMSGTNDALNNAISVVRRGGDVILFGLKSGDAVIEDFDRVIMDGIALHSVIGRRIFETWHISRNLLESRDPNIHDLIWQVMLNEGEGTIAPFSKYEPKDFEERIKTYPKVILDLRS
jgi:threonine 3-dehydrogenase